MNRIFRKGLFVLMACYGFLVVCHTGEDQLPIRNVESSTTLESTSTTFAEATTSAEVTTSSSSSQQMQTTTNGITTTSSVEATSAGVTTTSSSIECTLSVPQSVKATQGSFTDKIVVSWTSVTNATGYKIYRSGTDTGAYTEIGTSTTDT